ncbi:MAG: PD-(D/E)XK nuclease family protein, partial [Acidimicrobiia bacterium]
GKALLESLPGAGAGAGAVTLPAAPAVAPPPPFEDWAAERAAALARGARPSAVAATALTSEGVPDVDDLTAGLKKRPLDMDLPPWLKGRYGTAVGRAVHGVLQTVDLATGAGLDAAVAAQCEAEAIPERADDVRRLADFALAAPTVVEAAGAPHWREVYACAPLDGRLLEGYIDLLYRRAAVGLVVVDYKTAATSDPAVLDRRLYAYRLQGGSYAVAVAAATGDAVAEVVFVFLTPDGAVERRLEDLELAVGEVQALVGAGNEITAD